MKVEPTVLARPAPVDKLRDFLAEPDVEDPPVRRLGKYVLGRVLGRGGMGVVHEAEDLELKRRVALKILRQDDVETKIIQRLHREAAIAAQLQHPNIVTVYEVGMVLDADRRPVHFIAMEFVDGPTFGAWLRDCRPDVGPFLDVYQDILRAVAFAHARGVVHRDLKPANLLVGPDGLVKLTDFGLARARAFDSKLTQSHAVMGTPAYMAPEQVEGRCREVDARGDVYALGVILYEGLTGRSPYTAATQAELYRQILHGEFERPEGIARDLERICLKAMERFPSDRYASAAELALDVARYRAGEPVLAKGTRRFYRAVAKRKTWLVALAMTAIAALGFVDSATPALRAPACGQAREIELRRAQLRERLAPIEEQLRETKHLSYIPNADIAAAQRRISDALREIDGIEEAAVLRGLGWYFLGDLDRAEAALDGCRDPEAEYLLGRIALDRSVYFRLVRGVSSPARSKEWAARAVDHFSRAGKGDDLLARAHLELALGREDAVRELCARGLGDAPGTEEFYNLLGILARGKERVEAYTEALKRRPHYAWAYFMRASGHQALRDYGAARADLERAVELHPRFTPAYLDLGNVRNAQGDPRAAVALYTKALDIDPACAGARNNRAILLFELGDRDAALRDFEEALRLAPRDVAARLNLGHAWLRIGETGKALAEFDAARSSHGEDPEVHFGRGLALGRRDEAIEAFTTAILLRPDHLQARLRRGLEYTVRRDTRNALADLEVVLAAEPANWEALVGRATCWFLLGDVDRLVQDARAALRHAPRTWADRGAYEKIVRDAEARP